MDPNKPSVHSAPSASSASSAPSAHSTVPHPLAEINVSPPDQQTLERAKMFLTMTEEEWGTDYEVMTFSPTGEEIPNK